MAYQPLVSKLGNRASRLAEHELKAEKCHDENRCKDE